jgi:hypothetical protein
MMLPDHARAGRAAASHVEAERDFPQAGPHAAGRPGATTWLTPVEPVRVAVWRFLDSAAADGWHGR